MKPRPYQIEALDTIYEDLKSNPEVLLKAIMGSGKTFMSSKLIERLFFEREGSKFLVLAHKKELVEQFYSAFAKFTKIPANQIGVCCAGLKQKQINRRVTVATVQTFMRYRDKYRGTLTMLVIDECHTIPFHDSNSRYTQVIDSLRRKSGNCRILGLTATDARLGHGYIHGTKCKPGEPNLFQRVNHAIRYDKLVDEGYLVPLRGKIANHGSLNADLAGISINGDYVINQLGEVMSREQHIATAVEAIQEHCQDYKCICVFCCTIDHAIKVHQHLEAVGESATLVHSQLTDLERQGNMESWKQGRVRIMVSVNILIEGFDLPRLDCLVMARPTLSSTLFLQAVGRVLRIDGVKDHGMLIDLTDNTARFGTDLDNIKITIPKAAEKIDKKERELIKLCPSCEMEVSIYLRECECGYEWTQEEIIEATSIPELTNVTFEKPEPVWYDVVGFKVEVHESRKSGKTLGKITMEYGETFKQVYAWFCLSDFYSGYAVEQAKLRWADYSPDPFPANIGEFIGSDFIAPKRIALDISQQYPELEAVERGDDGKTMDDILGSDIPF